MEQASVVDTTVIGDPRPRVGSHLVEEGRLGPARVHGEGPSMAITVFPFVTTSPPYQARTNANALVLTVMTSVTVANRMRGLGGAAGNGTSPFTRPKCRSSPEQHSPGRCPLFRAANVGQPRPVPPPRQSRQCQHSRSAWDHSRAQRPRPPSAASPSHGQASARERWSRTESAGPMATTSNADRGSRPPDRSTA